MLDNIIQNVLNDLQGKKKAIQSTLPDKRTEHQRGELTMLDCSINRINYEAQTQNSIFNLVSGI